MSGGCTQLEYMAVNWDCPRHSGTVGRYAMYMYTQSSFLKRHVRKSLGCSEQHSCHCVWFQQVW